MGDVPALPPWLDDDLTVPDRTTWTIDGTRTAEWAMARLAYAQSALDDVEAAAAEWRLMIDGWVVDASRGHAADVAFFADQLQRWALDRRRETGEATVLLPSGTVRTQSRRDLVEVVDEDAVLTWAPEAAVKRSVRKRELVAALSFRDETVGYVIPDPVDPDAWQERYFDPSETDRDVPDGCVPIIDRVAVYDGRVAPGVAVQAERITASVTPRRATALDAPEAT